ncbi:MAG TPA: LolA-related protein [Steroidobacteraceae bacterium]
MRWLTLPCAVLGCTLALGDCPQPCAAAEPPTDPAAFEQLLQRLSARRHGHVAFTEVQQLSILDRPLHSSGELLYDAPGRLEKRTLEPRPEDLLLEDGTVTVERGHRRRIVALRDLKQAAPLIESLRATLAGDRAALERYFTVHFSGNLDRWSLELTPADPLLRRSVRRIHIGGEQDRVRTVEIYQSDGDSSTLTIGADLAP